jgi:hypothetical protein
MSPLLEDLVRRTRLSLAVLAVASSAVLGPCNPGGTTPTPTSTPAPPADGGTVGPGGPDLPGGIRDVVGSDGRGAGSGSLAYTGLPVAQLVGLGGALLVAGGLAIATGYRRPRGLAD